MNQQVQIFIVCRACGALRERLINVDQSGFAEFRVQSHFHPDGSMSTCDSHSTLEAARKASESRSVK